VAKLNQHRVPVLGIWIGGVIAVLSTVYSSAFNVLIAMLAVGWAGAYGVTILVGLRARLREGLPERPYKLKWWKLWYPLGIFWSFFFCVVMICQNPGQVGVGCASVCGRPGSLLRLRSP
jgi:amino acid transporter